MATSSALSTTNDKIAYKITITQNSQSVTGNTSNVTVSVRVYRTNTGYTTFGTGTVYVTINGTQYTDSITTADKITSSGVVIFSRTLNIAHNADGTKTLAVSARITHDQFSSSNQSFSQTLTTVPRATTPTLSASSVDMGKSITINLPRASGSFDHTVTYKFGGATGTIGSDLGTSKAWTVPLSLASEIPNATSGTVTITVKTYNGNTLIGTKTASFTARVPASVVPTFDSVAVADTSAAYATQFGSLVQNKSKAKFTIAASGAYGSTIKTYKTVIEGKSYSGASPTTAVLTGSGSTTATITITDSRGRTASTKKTFNMLAYTVPQITAFDVVRTNSAGVENYEGTHAKITAAFAVASVGSKNAATYKIEYKAQSATTWKALESGTGYTYNKSIVTGNLFSADAAYNIRLTVTDYFGSLAKTIDLSTAFTLLDFNASGRGVSFGKVSEREGIEFALPMYSTLGHLITSPVVLQAGTDLNALTEPGYYVFSSGTSTTLINSPLGGSGSGSIEIVLEGEAGQKRQVVTRCSDAYREIWERLFYSNSWKSWDLKYNGGGTILWEGGMYMTGGHKAEYSEPVSKQPNGIVLVFSEYYDGEVRNQTFVSHFVSKKVIAAHPGTGHCFWMCTSNMAYCATKYLYLRDDGVTGHANNNLVLTGSGITLNNNRFVMRYVIGV